jgi:hypothetical protein
VSEPEDPDDWFEGEPDDRPQAATEDWLVEAPPPRRSIGERVDRRVVVAAVVGIALLLAVLAAAGVFSSGGGSPAPPVVTPTVTISTTPATTPAPTTTTAPTIEVPTVELKSGDKGSQVTLLQQALKSLGYLTGKADGQFGPATEEAVKAFQRAKGLAADGVVGKATRDALAVAVRTQA